MLEKDIDKLPVIAGEGDLDLAGIITKQDLLYLLPSSAALLSLSEMDILFGATAVGRVMTQRVISISEDCPLEEAARLLTDHQIGSLPVMRGPRLVGMITKADIFCAMMEALGGQAEGFRITIRLHEDTGELGAITDGIVRLGGKLISLSTLWGGGAFHQTVTLKVQGLDPQELMSLLEKDIGVQVTDHSQSRMENRSEFASSLMHTETLSMQSLDGELIQLTPSR